MDILIEVFSVLIHHMNVEDVIIFYNLNKSFRTKLSSKYILQLLGFDNIDEYINYVTLGLPAHDFMNTYYIQLFNLNFTESIRSIWCGKETSRCQSISNLKINWKTRKIKANPFTESAICYIRSENKMIIIYMNDQCEMILRQTGINNMIQNYLYYFRHRYKIFINKQIEFINTKPWLLLNGKTPEEAVAIMKHFEDNA